MFKRADALTRRDWIALVLILLLAGWLRLTDLPISEFAKDEALLSTRAQQIVLGKNFPFLGTDSSIGTSNAPIAIYVLTIPYLVGSNPLAAVAFVALLNLVAIALLWFMVRRYFGFAPALIAGLLYACQVWAIYYSRKIWEPNLMSVFFLTALLLALLGFGEGKRWAQVLCFPILLLAFQIHFSTILLLPVFGLIIWSGRRNLSKWALLASILLAAFTLLPYVVGLLTSQKSNVAVASSGAAPQTATPFGASWTVFANIVTGSGSETVFDPVAPERLHSAVRMAEPLWILLFGLIICGTVYLWRTRRGFAIVCLSWLLLPPILMTPGWIKPYLHYMLALIPVACCLAGIGAAALLQSRLSRFLSLTFVALFVVTQTIAWRDLMAYSASTYTVPPGFRTPLQVYMPIHDALAPYQDVLTLNSKDYTASLDDYQFLAPLLYRNATCIRDVWMAQGGIALFPDHPFAVIQSEGSKKDPFYTKADALTISLRSGEGAYKISTFDQPPIIVLPPLTSIPSVLFDNGVMLDGYSFSDGNIYLQWRLPAATSTSYQYSVQFLDADGARINGRDTNFFDSKAWCKGDRAVTWIDVTVPADTVSVRVGMYHLNKDGTIVDVNAVDSTGNTVRGGEFPYPKDQ